MSFSYASLLGISNSTVDNLYVDNLNLTADYFTANGWTYKLPPKNDFIVLENAVQPITNKTIDASVIGSVTPSTGKFITVDTDELIIPDNKINGSKIVNTSINSEKIISLDGSKIIDSSIDSEKIVSLTCNKLSGDYITLMNSGHYMKGLKLADLEVTDTLSFPLNTLDGSFIKDDTISDSKIMSLDSSKLTGLLTFPSSGHYVGGLKVDDLNVTNTISLPAYSVDGAAIALNSITNNKMVSLDSSKLTGLLNFSTINHYISGLKTDSLNVKALDVSVGINLPVGSVLGDRIVVNSLPGDRVVSLNGSKLIDNTVTSGKIVSLDGSKLIDNSVTSGKIVSLNGSKLIDSSVTSGKIVSLDGSKLIDNSVTTGKIVSVDSSKITGTFYPTKIKPADTDADQYYYFLRTQYETDTSTGYVLPSTDTDRLFSKIQKKYITYTNVWNSSQKWAGLAQVNFKSRTGNFYDGVMYNTDENNYHVFTECRYNTPSIFNKLMELSNFETYFYRPVAFSDTIYPNVKWNSSKRIIIGGGSNNPASEYGNTLVLNSDNNTTNCLIAINRIGRGSVFLGCNQEVTDYNGTGGVLGFGGGCFKLRYNMDFGAGNILASGTEGLVLTNTGKLSSKNNTLDDNGSMTVTNGLTVNAGAVTLPNNSVSGNAISSIDASKVTGRMIHTSTKVTVTSTGNWRIMQSGASSATDINYGNVSMVIIENTATPASVSFKFPTDAEAPIGSQLIVANRVGKTIYVADEGSYAIGTSLLTSWSNVIEYPKIYTFVKVRAEYWSLMAKSS